MRAVGKAGARRRLSGAAHACDAVSSDRLAGPRRASCAPADREAVGWFSRSHLRSACRDALPASAVVRMSGTPICPSRILRVGLGWSRRSPCRTDPAGLAIDTGGPQFTATALSSACQISPPVRGLGQSPPLRRSFRLASKIRCWIVARSVACYSLAPAYKVEL